MHGLAELEDDAKIESPMDLELVVLPCLGLPLIGLYYRPYTGDEEGKVTLSGSFRSSIYSCFFFVAEA